MGEQQKIRVTRIKKIKKENQMIKFKDLSIWLKVSAVGGFLSVISESIAFVVYFIQGYIGAIQ